MCAKLLLFFKLPTICKKNTCKKWTTTPKIGQEPDFSPSRNIYKEVLSLIEKGKNTPFTKKTKSESPDLQNRKSRDSEGRGIK